MISFKSLTYSFTIQISSSKFENHTKKIGQAIQENSLREKTDFLIFIS